MNYSLYPLIQIVAQKEENSSEVSTILKRGIQQFATNIEVLISTSSKYKFYQGLIILFTATGERKKAIDLFIQSDDLESFKKVMADNFRESEWKYLLSLLDSIPDVSSNTNITIEIVMEHMINCIDVMSSIQLLLSHSFFSKRILQSSEVLKQLVQKGKIEEHQREIRNKVLETLNNYLWAKKSPTLPPQVRAVLELELLDKDPKKSETNQRTSLETLPFLTKTKSRGMGEGNNLDLAFDYVGVPRFVEDSNLHWGSSVGSDLTPIYSHSQANTSSYVSGTCGYCTLPLEELITDASSSLIIFPCGHAFHQICNLEMDACTICYQSNLVTLLAE